jgi:hypothetical protein
VSTLQEITLDKKLLALDDAAQRRVRSEVEGFLYGLKSVWDFLFGSVVEFSESNREAAREILRNQAQETLELLVEAVNGWNQKARAVKVQAMRELSQKEVENSKRKEDAIVYTSNLQERLAFLNKSKPVISMLCNSLKSHIDTMTEARDRLVATRESDFSATIYTEEGQLHFCKGREYDLLLLHRMSKSPWRYLELNGGGWNARYYPRAQRHWARVYFVHEAGQGALAVYPPPDASRFELNLSSLQGVFRVRRTE